MRRTSVRCLALPYLYPVSHPSSGLTSEHVVAVAAKARRRDYIGSWVAEVAVIYPNGRAIRGFSKLQDTQLKILRLKQGFLKRRTEMKRAWKKAGTGGACVVCVCCLLWWRKSLHTYPPRSLTPP